MKLKRSRPSLWISLCLLIVFAIPIWLTWRTVRQERLNQELIEAVQDRQVKEVRDFLAVGADANARDRGSNAITFKGVFLDLLQRLRRGDSHLKTYRGSTALELALGARPANAEIATALLQKGADPNAMVIPEFGWRLLHWAVLDSSPELIQALLRAGANVNARDITGDTALMLIAPKSEPPANHRFGIQVGQNTFITGTMVVHKAFSDVPATHWAFEAIPEYRNKGMAQEQRQTASQRQAIIQILKQTERHRATGP